MRIQDLEETIKENRKFINSYTLEELIKFLKEVAIDVIPFISDSAVIAINNITDTTISRDKDGICSIKMSTNYKDYEDIFIELNTSYITISRQKGHTTPEQECSIPLHILTYKPNE